MKVHSLTKEEEARRANEISNEAYKNRVNFDRNMSGLEVAAENAKKKADSSKNSGDVDAANKAQAVLDLARQQREKESQIEKDYRSGKLLTGELKTILIEKINVFLKEHQKKKEKAKSEINKFLFKG